MLAQRTINKLDSIKQILEEYKNQGYLPVTLRHLYYKLVSRTLIENKVEEYRKVVKLMTYARENHIIPYSYLTDSSRTPKIVSQFDNLKDLGNAAINSYKKCRWKCQDCYLEVWIEKAAMTSTIEDITRKYCVPLITGKGYNSLPIIWDAYNRMKEYNKEHNIIIYLGDHDPSGVNMDLDIRNRFMKNFGIEPDIQRIALTMDQIQQYNLPSQFAKKKDPRYKKYKNQYGSESWEIEALPIKIIRELLENKIREYIDPVKYNRVLEQEEQDKERFMEMIEELL